MEKQVSEGSLHKWFKGSKSKDGKGGWVNVVTGGTCASDEPGEGTPKCVSSAKRASMTKAERLSAARRKKKADPNQQQKSGAAKPTYVSTDKPKKKKMKESYTRSLTPLTEKAKKCWPGYEKKGTKKMFGKTYNNCVKKEEVEIGNELNELNKQERMETVKQGSVGVGKRFSKKEHGKGQSFTSGGNVGRRNMRRFEKSHGGDGSRKLNKFGSDYQDDYRSKDGLRAEKSDHAQKQRRAEHEKRRGVKTKGVKEAYSVNSAQQAAIAIAKKKKKEEDMVAMKKKKKSMYAGYEPQGELVDEDLRIKAIEYGAKNNIPGTGMLAKTFDFERKLRKGEKGDGYIGHKSLNIKNPFASKPIIKDYPSKKEYQDSIKNKTSNQYSSYDPEGETIEETDKKGKGSGTKDACYHKVKSRYSVWPSAYASGALVKCRKVGAANWGNSSKKEDFSDWKSEFIWEDGDSSKKLTEEDELTKLRNALKTKTMDGKPLNDKQLEGIKAAITQGGNKLEEDWQKTNRQDKTDGMSKAAVKAYRRENPGSKLKTAVTKKPSSLKRGSKDAKRRKSFCSRMKGMKKRLTSAKTARDPDSRINKALRRWNC